MPDADVAGGPPPADLGTALQQEYRLRFAAQADYRRAVWRILCEDYFSRYIKPTDTVLDLGSGWGEFISQIAAGKKYAMDLNPDAGPRLPADVQFLRQDCSKEWPVAEGSLDVVFTSNFLEHLPDKAHVDGTLAQAYRCLRPGGQLICLGPNIKYLPGAYWDFWDHYVALTELSLAEAQRLRGFEVTTCLPRFLPYSMSTGKTPPLFLVRWYLRLPFAWPWFGKQFLVVGRKPS